MSKQAAVALRAGDAVATVAAFRGLCRLSPGPQDCFGMVSVNRDIHGASTSHSQTRQNWACKKMMLSPR